METASRLPAASLSPNICSLVIWGPRQMEAWNLHLSVSTRCHNRSRGRTHYALVPKFPFGSDTSTAHNYLAKANYT